ncbi:TnsD family Tn7-like transposition protein [Croceicoccus mobilis]|uniref:TnsD family Tn7-like transposition protein n=1 Tax=Croceicoccus mobilis TaxID=1703339 RepID=UPI0009EE8582|nr:TnsD family Tn7-like transposition protein [Croceicoccus mobilis]
MSWLPKPYPDETFYSLLVRLHLYLGRPTYSAFSRMLTGGRHYVALSHLPCGLSALGEHLKLGRTAVDQLIDRTTTFNYHTAFASEAVRDRARTEMHEIGSSLHLVLGLATFPISLPDRLRFCPQCLAEMEGEFGEVWWCRSHQLPGVEVCHRHGSWLEGAFPVTTANRHSLVFPRVHQKGMRLETASKPTDAQALFARLSAELLVNPPRAKSPPGWHSHYRHILNDTGLIRGNSQVRANAVHDRIRKFWTSNGGFQCPSDLLSKSALVDFFRNQRRLAPPAQHLLIGQALAALPPQERPFGRPPYRCENPLAEHFGERVVTRLRTVRDKGKLHGHFSCDCGYSYSRTRQIDGSIGCVRLRECGPAARRFLGSDIAAGMSLRAKARKMRVDPMTVKAIEHRLSLTNSFNQSREQSV